MTQALVVHQSDVVRAGVAALLATGSACEVTHAASIFEAFRLAGAIHPQLVLFDYSSAEGAEATRLFAGIWPRPKLVALVRGQSVSARDCLDAGADAAVAIDNVTRDNFLALIQRTIEGSGPVAAGFTLEAVKSGSVEAIDDSPTALLTRREREMLYLIGEGLSNKEIADALVLSVKTVEAHRANLSRKLNIRSRAGLMRLAMSGALSGGVA
jgi:DNA-binding NarL/FixJ family response regulator